MNLLEITAYIIMGISSSIAAATIGYFLHSKVWKKPVYQFIIMIQITHILGLLLRVVYKDNMTPGISTVISICTDAVLYGIVFVDLNIIGLFENLDSRISKRAIRIVIVIAFIWAVWNEVMYYLVTFGGKDSIGNFYIYPYLVYVFLGVLYTNIQGVYLTRMIYYNLKRVTDEAKWIFTVSVISLVSMIILDWVDVFLYLYQRTLVENGNKLSTGKIIVCMTDLHSILASFLFQQFKNMISTQIRKPNLTPKTKDTLYC
ncbi:hypothetical protein HDV01_001227 [Terramyces sp. JEL0728]|nr:hypothetical protein HDV01_001227 [Terramyces sp. JEL0728]